MEEVSKGLGNSRTKMFFHTNDLVLFSLEDKPKVKPVSQEMRTLELKAGMGALAE